ncbi:LAME_0F00210g1_1 [Lachancea meyersii CBS 8951]|uniref:LAME_0F00210g1_1 n=1 Tax=Lachancea meyersii CBS 8951 TaxID=1266667 RepID=A0A1G4JPI8_9SACH|nr:LAME_0F00210g1_1 [Lachancea meyersii CBS 8951]
MVGKCCFTGSLHEGEASGAIKEAFGLETYITGSSSSAKIIVILTDVFGLNLINTKLIADQFGKAGYEVYVPDILFGEAIEKVDESVNIQEFIHKHRPEVTRPIVDKFLLRLKEKLNPKFLGVIGYCFGAKYALDHIKAEAPVANAAAIAHPSFIEVNQLKVIGKSPLLISAAQDDHIFPMELRHESEKTLIESGAVFRLDLFGNVSHGFAVRGDLSDPLVKYAKEKVFSDQLDWFNQFSSA